MKTIVNTYKTIKNKKVNDTITVEKWLNEIQNPSKRNLDIINTIRTYPKGHKEYDRLKTTLPTITWNGTFILNREIDCLNQPTQMLFIDIDDCNYDIFLLDITKVFSMWKSVGSCGWTLLVKCNGITKDNFKDYYVSVVNDLDLSEYYDKSCNDITRQNVLSYDTDLYINEDCYVYNYEIKDTIKERFVPTDLTAYRKDYRLNNLDDIASGLDFEGGRCLYIKDGYHYVESNSFWSKNQDKNRTNMLLSYTNNLVWLNPNTAVNIINTMVENANGEFKTPLLPHEVKSIIKSVYGYLHNGTLSPKISIKKRKFIWNDNYTRQDKMNDVHNKRREVCANESTEKIYNIIEDWDWSLLGKISQAKMVKNYPISKKTVEKYWSEFKDTIEGLNEGYKLSMKEYDE